MGAIAAAVSEAATAHGSFHIFSPKCNPKIRDLERRRRIESDPVQRTVLTEEIWKLRRDDRRLKANKRVDFLTQTGRAREYCRECTPRPPVAALDAEADRNRWPSVPANHYRTVFCNASPELQIWRNAVLKKIQSRAEKFRKELELDIVFSVDEVFQAISLLKRGKCVLDGVSSEMLQALDGHCVLMLAVPFRRGPAAWPTVTSGATWSHY